MERENRFSQFSGYFRKYIDKVHELELNSMLDEQINVFNVELNHFKGEKEEYRYADEKWTPKELVVHLTDTERVMAYRALAIARGEKQVLPSFDENEYASQSEANEREFKDILAEWLAVRVSTMYLYRSFSEEALARTGQFSGSNLSVEAIAYLIAGHVEHHLEVLRERYL